MTVHTTKRNLRRLLLLCAVTLALAPVAQGHHSQSEFDLGSRVFVEGTVTKLEWTNPHARVYIDVADEEGEIVSWDFELGPPNNLMRLGWNRNSLKAGHVVTIEGFLSKSEAHVANARSVRLDDGRQVFAGSSFDTGEPETAE